MEIPVHFSVPVVPRTPFWTAGFVNRWVAEPVNFTAERGWRNRPPANPGPGMNLGFTAPPIIVPEGQAVNRKQETKHNHKQGTNHPETITIKRKRQATSSRSDARPQFREPNVASLVTHVISLICSWPYVAEVHDGSELSNNRYILAYNWQSGIFSSSSHSYNAKLIYTMKPPTPLLTIIVCQSALSFSGFRAILSMSSLPTVDDKYAERMRLQQEVSCRCYDYQLLIQNISVSSFVASLIRCDRRKSLWINYFWYQIMILHYTLRAPRKLYFDLRTAHSLHVFYIFI